MPLTLYPRALRWFASTSSFASATPFSAVFSSSTGVSALHGPHQSAQKSTTTGSCIDRSITSVSKVSSVTSISVELIGELPTVRLGQGGVGIDLVEDRWHRVARPEPRLGRRRCDRLVEQPLQLGF